MDFEFDDDAWADISDEAKDLITQIFQSEQTRISAKKILNHPWLKHYTSTEIKTEVLDRQLSKLKEFQNKSKFRKAILTFLSCRVTDEDVSEEKKLFEQLDK